jgi:hypothetical protein
LIFPTFSRPQPWPGTLNDTFLLILFISSENIQPTHQQNNVQNIQLRYELVISYMYKQII